MAENDRLKDHYQACFRKYRRGFRKHSANYCFRALLEGRKDCFKLVVDNVLYRTRKHNYKKEFCDLDKSMASRTGNMRICFCAYSNLPKSVVRSSTGTIDELFEGMTVKLPVGNDKILRQIYGDYMQLPPKFERVPGHAQYFADFSASYDIDPSGS